MKKNYRKKSLQLHPLWSIAGFLNIPLKRTHARTQVFLWMGDQLAAFFALPPSQLRVGAPTSSSLHTLPLRRDTLTQGEAVGGRTGLASSMQLLNVAGPSRGSGMGRGGRGGRGRVRGGGVFEARSRANTWLQGAAAAGTDANAPELRYPDGDAAEQIPTTAVSGEDAAGVTSAGGGRVGGDNAARGGKWRNAEKRAVKTTEKKNLPVPSKNDREMLWDGKNVGSLPNMMWRAVSMEDLRLHPHFVGLPEPEDVRIESAMDYRKFRQGSKEWGLLHDGRLTTRCVCLSVYNYVCVSLRLRMCLCMCVLIFFCTGVCLRACTRMS